MIGSSMTEDRRSPRWRDRPSMSRSSGQSPRAKPVGSAVGNESLVTLGVPFENENEHWRS